MLRVYSLTMRPRTTHRLAWLSDITSAIDRRSGFLADAGRNRSLVYSVILAPSHERDVWDSLGRPMAKYPTSPLWKRWRISYDADLAVFEQRAKHLMSSAGNQASTSP